MGLTWARLGVEKRYKKGSERGSGPDPPQEAALGQILGQIWAKFGVYVGVFFKDKYKDGCTVIRANFRFSSFLGCKSGTHVVYTLVSTLKIKIHVNL